MLKPLPIGTQTFSKIIEGKFLYVDKTYYLYQLLQNAIGVYFCARPRRFGKSLLVSTLAEILQGHKELFKNLWIYDSDYSWESYALIRLDFSRHRIRHVDDLEISIKRQLRYTARQYDLTLDDASYDLQFEDLIFALAEKKRVAILIDEYDTNYEVKSAFLTYLLGAFSELERTLTGSYLRQLLQQLQEEDFQHLFDTLNRFFAHIPYDLHLHQEKYYQTIFYLIFLIIGLEVEAEVKTNRGRIDVVVVLAGHVYLFEFKLDGSADEALTQIKKTGYYQKYQSYGEQITLIGANFDREMREVTEWQVI